MRDNYVPFNNNYIGTNKLYLAKLYSAERSEKLIGTYLNTRWTHKILSVNQSNH